jgi:hypothetical protein
MLAVNIYELTLETLEDTGLNFSWLSRNYRAETPQLVERGGVAQIGNHLFPQGVIPAGKGAVAGDFALVTVLRQHVQSDLSILSRPRILVVDDKNAVVDSVNAGELSSTEPRITLIKGVETGELIVLSGLIKDSTAENRAHRLPLLQGIPVLGWLFKQNVRNDSKSSLLITLTPKIIKDQLSQLPPAKTIVGWQITAATDGWVYKRKIRDTGKVVGKEIKVFDHGKKLQFMTGDKIEFGESGAPAKQVLEVIVVWQKRNSSKRHEIRAKFLKLRI